MDGTHQSGGQVVKARPKGFDGGRIDLKAGCRRRSHEQREFGGLTENRTRVHGFAGQDGSKPFNGLAAERGESAPKQFNGLQPCCKLIRGRFQLWFGGAGRALAHVAGQAAPRLHTSLFATFAGGLAPASEKPRRSYEAPAVGPTTKRSLRGAAGCPARILRSRLRDGAHSPAWPPAPERSFGARGPGRDRNDDQKAGHDG